MILVVRMVGEQIGNYRVIGPPITWPLADVCVGQDARTGQVVDIVLLPPDTAASAGGTDQFLTGMRAVLSFRHPGFVKLLDCDHLSDGTRYLVSEHVEAECLSERLKRDDGLLSDLATVREIGIQTAAALEAAHEAGLLYLCLRPEHMLLVPAGQPGLPVTVRLLELGLGNHFLSRICLMAPGKELPVSLLHYSSPEQCRGSGVDPRSDIYALGCVLFEILVGRLPFQVTDLWGLVAAHAHEMPPRIRDLRPELPSTLDDLVATMLEKEPAQRPFSMAEIIAVLRAAIPEPAAIAESAPIPPPAALAKTVVLDTGPPVPKPADDVPSAPSFRPTRLLTPEEEARVPRRPAAIATPSRVERDPLPASGKTAPVRRRPTPPSKRGSATVNTQRSSHALIFGGIALACVALGVGLLLWFLYPKANQVPRTPAEETPADQKPVPPPTAPSPAPAAIEMPTPATDRPAAEPAQPRPGLADKPLSNPAKNREPSRRTKSKNPASPRSLPSHEGVIQPTFMKP